MRTKGLRCDQPIALVKGFPNRRPNSRIENGVRGIHECVGEASKVMKSNRERPIAFLEELYFLFRN